VGTIELAGRRHPFFHPFSAADDLEDPSHVGQRGTARVIALMFATGAMRNTQRPPASP
jgi:hypothetical protein